jgi:signal peptidase I
MGTTPERIASIARRPQNPYRVIRWILDAALIGLILIALAGAALGRLVPLTGRETLIIGGASMEPEIQLGAAVVIEPVDPDQIAVGDIVSLRSGEGLKSIFTHRVTRVISRPDGIWIETKGDANRIVDASITPATDVIGRVVLNVPNGGFLLKLLSVPSGVALMICLAGMLVASTWLLETMEFERRRWPRPVPAGTRPVGGRPADGDAPARVRKPRTRRATATGPAPVAAGAGDDGP